jgi:hypothetical protein
MLRIALNNVAALVNDNEDNWLIREILMQHKNSLHSQIDILIKEKRKLNHRRLSQACHHDFSAPKRLREL